MRDALDKLLADEYVVEERMMLEGAAFHNGKQILQDIALNDIVIGRQGRLRILDFRVYVNGEFLNASSADGIIYPRPPALRGTAFLWEGPLCRRKHR